MVLGVQELNVSGNQTYGSNCPIGPYAFGAGSFSNQCDAFHFWSPHYGAGGYFVMADGSVHFITYSAAKIMPALATRSGGEAATVPQ